MSELFLAEAAVRVRADTSGFRATLLAEVESAVRAAEAIAKVRITPIAAGAAGAGAAAGASEQAAASKIATTAIKEETVALGELAATEKTASEISSEAAAQKVKDMQVQRTRTAVEDAYGKALARTALLQKAGVLSVSEVAALRAKLAASTSAVTAADIAWRKAIQGTAGSLAAEDVALRKTTATLLANNTAVQAATFNELRLAEARAASAASAARSATAESARTAGISKGIGATGLTFLGARGATLAASGPFLAGAAAATVFAKSVLLAAGTERELNVFRVTAGATADEMERVSAASKQLGSDISLPGVSAGDAASAMSELAKAGLSVKDSITGARGALLLATAANIDNARSVEIIASALNVFKLSGADASHVADLLATASIQAQGSISDMGDALINVAPVAKQVGLSLEDTTALLTLLAKNGVQGANGGTVLRVALLRLVAPTDKVKKIFDELDLTLRDVQGRLRPEVFSELNDKLNELTGRRRADLLTQIFGERGIRGAAILGREGAAALKQISDEQLRAGDAAAIAGARTAGLAGAAENLKNQAERTGLAIGNLVSGPLTIFVTQSASVIQAAGTIAEKFGEMASQAKAAAGPISDLIKPATDFAAKVGGIKVPFTGIDVKDIAKAKLAFTSPAAPVLAPIAVAGFINQQRELRGEAQKTADDVSKILQNLKTSPGEILPLATAVQQLDKLAAKLRGGDAEAQKLAGAVETVRRQLVEAGQAGTKVAPFKNVFDITLPPELVSGQPGRTAGRATIDALTAELSPSTLFGITNSGFRGFIDGIKSNEKAAVGAAKTLAVNVWVAANAAFKQGQLEFNQAVIADSTKGQIAALDVQIKAQQKILDDAAKKLAGLSKGQAGFKLQKERQAAATAALAGLFTQRRGLVDQVAADAKAAKQETKDKATEIEQANNDADQAFLKSLEPRRAILDRLITVAEGTDTEADNRRILVAMKKRAFAEIDLINAHVKDKKLAAQLIEARRKEIVDLDNQIAASTKAIADSANETARKNADALTASLAKNITLAGLRENDKAQIAAINKAIANAKFRIRNYKKLGLNLQDEKIALETLINQRDEVNNTAKDAKDTGGTTAFDLLKEFADTFNQNAGNLINQNQPFAGPTGFTADIAQFLVRRPGAQAPSTAKADFTAPLVSSNAELIKVIRENTDAIRGNGGNAAAGVSAGVNAVGQRGKAMGEFWKAKQARDAAEARSGV